MNLALFGLLVSLATRMAFAAAVNTEISNDLSSNSTQRAVSAVSLVGFEAAVRATLSQHPLLASKRAEVAAKGYAGDTARAQRYPTLTGQAAAHDDSSQPMTLRARQPIWTFGRIDRGIAYASADLTVEEADLQRIKRHLIDQTAVAYARVQGIRLRLRVADDTTVSLDKLHQQIQRREQSQFASLADVRLAFARLVQARAQQGRLQGELIVALSELVALTQTPVDSTTRVPDAWARLPVPELNEIEALALAHSADVLVKTARVALAQADIEREKTSPMPTVYLQAERYFDQSGFGNDLRVGIVLEGSLDNLGYAAAGRSKVAGARLQASLEDLNSTRNEIRRSVNSLYANGQLQYNLVDAQGESVQELEKILASYQRQYESGHKAWLDVLNTQRELSEQRMQYAQAENEALIYTLKLKALIGGLDALEILHSEKET
jgi:adhesin transport system outer membrane protein